MIVPEITRKWPLICLLSCFVISVGAQRTKDDWCDIFESCYPDNPVCKLLFNFLDCEFTNEEPPNIECGVSPVTGPAHEYSMPRILGGVNALEGEFPWSVFLEGDGESGGLCGGTILDRTTILTAAHCVNDLVERPGDLTVGYGSRNLSSLRYASVRNITVHPGYVQNTNNDHDIAVLKLEEKLPLDETLVPACLPEYSYTYYHGVSCMVTGWGKTEEVGYKFPELLQKATVPLVPLGLCQSAYRGFASLMIAERQLCAGYYEEGSTDACQGDSGGPLVCAEGNRWVLQGLVSTGNGCGRSRFPGVYTYVPQYVTWIRSFLN